MPVDETTLEEYYNHVSSLVLQSGQIMKAGYDETQKGVKTKTAFYDLVTKYDKEIEDLLVNGISEKYPDHKFIGEESSAESTVEPELTDAPTWIIDPIDGTCNFIKKIPHTCISIGLAVDKELVMGIVYNPIINEFFTARKGQGAFCNGERIHVSERDQYKDGVVGIEISLAHAKFARDNIIKTSYQLASNATGTRSFGSAALALCYVANGSLECYHIEYLKPWDMAAGVVLIREAGGVVYHPSGREFDIMHPDLVAACCEGVCQEMIGLIEKAKQMTDVHFD